MKVHTNLWLWSAIAAGCLASSSSAQTPFVDNFDSYALGSVINGQGGWKQWGGGANSTSKIVNNTTGFARSGRAVSIDAIQGGEISDLVHEFTGFTSGQHTMRVYTYGSTGETDEKWYFIVMNTYADAVPFKWSVQVTFDPVALTYSGDCGQVTP